jgi:hypothetical protein
MTESPYITLAYTVWSLIAILVAVMLFRSYWRSRPKALTVLRTVEELEEATVHVVKEKQLPSDASRARKGRRTLPTLEYVDFNPKNKEHCIALDMLMQEPSRLHPTLRFHFDPAVHDNAHIALLCMLASYHIEKMTKPKVTKDRVPDMILEGSAPKTHSEPTPFPTMAPIGPLRLLDAHRPFRTKP